MDLLFKKTFINTWNTSRGLTYLYRILQAKSITSNMEKGSLDLSFWSPTMNYTRYKDQVQPR
jgi:hypothetical protein